MRRGVPLVVLIGLLAGCTSSPPSPHGTLKISVTGVPAGRVHVTGPRLDTLVTRDQELRDLDPGRYVLDIEPVPDSRAHAIRYPLAARLEVVVPGTVEVNYGVEVPDTTKVLDPGLVSDAGQSTLVLTQGAAGLVLGQVLVAGLGPKTPQGLLRKVVAVHAADAGVRVDTEPATLADAVPVGEISLRQHTFSGVTVHNGRGSTANRDIAAVFPFTGVCDGKVSGGIQLTWTPSVDLEWKWSKAPGAPTRVDRARFAVESTRFLSARFSANAGRSCAFEVSYPSVPDFVGTTELMLGPVPVVLTATARFSSHSQLEAKAEGSFENTERFTLGMEYKDGKLDRFPEAERQGCDPARPAELSTRVGVRFGLQPSALAGPDLDLTFGLRGPAVCTDFHAGMSWDLAALSR